MTLGVVRPARGGKAGTVGGSENPVVFGGVAEELGGAENTYFKVNVWVVFGAQSSRRCFVDAHFFHGCEEAFDT